MAKERVKISDEMIPTRQSLLSRLRDWDDSDSWQEFFNTYWKLIYGVAKKAGLTEVEAQEVVQETVIAVSKKMPGFRYDPQLGSFKGWLLHMTRWRINDQLRKRRRDAKRGSAAEPAEEGTSTIERVPDPGGGELDAVWDEEWQKAVLDAAIARVKKQVNPRQYQIFDLYVVKKWPLEKVTSVLEISAGQAYLAKHRISALIKKEVKALEKQLI